MKSLPGLLAGMAFAGLVQAEPAEPTPSPEKQSTVPIGGSAVRELADGTIDVGGVIVDKQKNSIRFPAAVNMRKGYVEYLLVGTTGKTHESVLVTQVSPQFVHVAMLLLGAKGAPEKKNEPARAPGNIDESYLSSAPKVQGDRMTVHARWQEAGKEKRVPVENLITMGDDMEPVPEGEWVYNGSMVIEGRFIAQDDQSFITLITDPGALVNNPRPERVRDDIWQSRTDVIPEEGTPIEIEFTLSKPESKANDTDKE